MGGSAKPRRKKAATPALRYEHRPGERGGLSGGRARRKGQSVFGCLIAALTAGGIVAIALLDTMWGDDTWRWAARSLPGGAYGFAVCLGISAPCLFALSVWSSRKAGRRSWKADPVRALGRTVLALAAAAPLVPFLSLAFNAMDDGTNKGRRTGPPSWVFSHFPWLWAVGIISTVLAVAMLVLLLVALSRRREALLPSQRTRSEHRT